MGILLELGGKWVWVLVALSALLSLPFLFLAAYWIVETGEPLGHDSVFHLGKWRGWNLTRIQSDRFFNGANFGQEYLESYPPGYGLLLQVVGLLPVPPAVTVSLVVVGLSFFVLPLAVAWWAKDWLPGVFFILLSNVPASVFVGGTAPMLIVVLFTVLFLATDSFLARALLVAASFFFQYWGGSFLAALFAYSLVLKYADGAVAFFASAADKLQFVFSQKAATASSLGEAFLVFPLAVFSVMELKKPLHVGLCLLAVLGGMAFGARALWLAVPLLCVLLAKFARRHGRGAVAGFLFAGCLYYVITFELSWLWYRAALGRLGYG